MPEIAADAMGACTQETNRLNRRHRKLIGIHPPRACRSRKAIAEIVRFIEQGGWHRGRSDRLTALKANQNSLAAHRGDAIA